MNIITLSMDEILVPDMIRRIATIQQDYTIWQTLSQTSKNINVMLKGLDTSLTIPCYSCTFSRITGNESLERKDMVPDKWTGINSFLSKYVDQNPETMLQYEFDDHNIKKAFCGRNAINSDGVVYGVTYRILFSDGIRVEGYGNEEINHWSYEETGFIDFYKNYPIMLIIEIGKWSKQDFIHIIFTWISKGEQVTLEVEAGSIKWFGGYGDRGTKSLPKVKLRYLNRETWCASNTKIIAIIEHIEKSEFGNDVFLGVKKSIERLKFPKLVLSKLKNMNDQNSKLITSILSQKE